MNIQSHQLSINIDPLIDSYNLYDQKKPIVEIDNNILNKDLINLFNRKNITLGRTLCFYKPPFSRGRIHIDGRSIGDYIKINFIITENKSWMEWYEFPTDANNFSDELKIDGGGSYVEYTDKNYKVIEKKILSGWNLVQAGVPHNVFNYCNTPRYCISIIPYVNNNRITMSEGLGLFSEYC